jgi:serine/threonine-protein kinase
VDGDDLLQKIENQTPGGFLEENQILLWTQQILEALEYLHLQDPPVVHRDIKPSNIKVNTAGIIKLVDFGLVKVMTPEERTVTIVQGRGTIHYTPIEQYGGDAGHTDLRSDIYSLGCTLYHLLTSQPPPEAKIRFLHSDSMTPIRKINPNVSPRTERAIHWALSLHPEDRPATTNAFKSALFEGLFPDEKGVPEYMPETSKEWVQHALADPLHRDLAIVSTLLIVLAVITTFTA